MFTLLPVMLQQYVLRPFFILCLPKAVKGA